MIILQHDTWGHEMIVHVSIIIDRINFFTYAIVAERIVANKTLFPHNILLFFSLLYDIIITRYY